MALEQLSDDGLMVTYTIFKDVYPKAADDMKLHADMPWCNLVAHIENAPTYLRKNLCPLISMGEYGGLLSTKGYLRHADNVIRIYGVECDYDGERVDIHAAQRLLAEASIRAALYTSPSHTTDRPRWRCLLPLAEPATPDKRELYVGRANRILGGILSRESFTLSQSFYIGRVASVTYEACSTAGRCIDIAGEVEPLYLHDRAHDNGIDKRTDEDLIATFERGENRYDAMLKLSARYAARGLDVDDIEANLNGFLSRGNAHNADGIDLHTRVRPMAESAVKKFGDPRIQRAIKPSKDEERPPLIADTDMAFSRRLLARHGKDLAFTPERGWLVWSGSKWQTDDKAVMVSRQAQDSAESMLDEIRDAADKKEAFKTARLACQKRAIEAAMWLSRSFVTQAYVHFDAHPMLFNAQNGLVDLATGRLMPHDREKLCSLIGGCDFDMDATAPRWQSFIGEICLERVELMDYLQRVCGYMLTADVSEQCLFFMYGDGSNGKSVFVETVMHVLGDYATAAQPDLIMVKRHQGIPIDVAKLRGMRAAFMNETSQGARFDEPKLKDLTGGDTLEARFMRENLFTFKPTHKLMLRGNYKPAISGTDEGIWRRLRLIPFDLRMDKRQINPRLADELKREAAGILAWMVRGCLEWQREGLNTPQLILDLVAEYRASSDSMGKFIAEKCALGANNRIKSSSLYRSYKEWCESNNERAMSNHEFPNELQKRGIDRKPLAGVNWFKGIELIQENTFQDGDL